MSSNNLREPLAPSIGLSTNGIVCLVGIHISIPAEQVPFFCMNSADIPSVNITSTFVESISAVTYPEGCVDHCHGCGKRCPNGAITYNNDDTGWIPPRDAIHYSE